MPSRFERLSRHLSATALLLGIIFDYLTLSRIDLLVERVIFLSYLVAAVITIIYLSFNESRSVRGLWTERLHTASLFALQFIFGGLFSRFFIFYSQSGALATSWPFLLMLFTLLVGNEIFQKRYSMFVFRMSIFFIALFSYAIFAVPMVVGSIGPWVFVLSGIISLVVMYLVIRLEYRLLGSRLERSSASIYASIIVIFASINVAYYLNLIPPIPLSIKSAGIYHDVQRVDGQYIGKDEVRAWHERLLQIKRVHLVSSEELSAFASVFSPTRINVEIVHDWQYWLESKGEWVSKGRIAYPISGGRDGGYRGYTTKANLDPGLWRVDVETNRGQVIGRLKFRVIPILTTPATTDIVL